MDFTKKTKNAAKHFRSSFVLSFFFHALVFALFIIPYSYRAEVAQKPMSVIEANLVEYSKPQEKNLPISLKATARTLASESAPAKKPAAKLSLKKSLSVSRPIERSPSPTISSEGLQNDMRRVAENIAFGPPSAGMISASGAKTSSSAAYRSYRSYINAYQEKLTRIGNTSNKAAENGTVTLHITIGKNGEVTERYAVSDSPELKNEALQVIEKGSPFDPFPKDIPMETIKISFNLHFVSQ
ncbi:MAG: energy transducer TonB [Candidatus Paceibacterota bacterium]|jgi:outer membrane biosynthesis protein TonB